LKKVPGLQVRPGAMVESSRGGIEDEWCCGIAHAYFVIYIVAIIIAGTTGKSTAYGDINHRASLTFGNYRSTRLHCSFKGLQMAQRKETPTPPPEPPPSN